ncbi:MAG: hypothetical protein ACR2P0_02650 [Acidimicrobiales bacterium]
MSSSDPPPTTGDPILQQRARIRRGSNQAQRLGFLLYGVAMILFFVGLFTSFEGPIVTLIIVLLVVASIITAVAIQVGYAIKGAERHEEDSAAQRRRR